MTRINAPLLPDARSAIVDGTPEPDGNETDALSTDEAATPQGPDLGPWLTLKDEEVARQIDKAWTEQDARMKPLLSRWDLNERRRDGDVYSKLVADPDNDSVRLYTPIGVEYAPPPITKTDELCEKMIAQLIADPPLPECEPSKDSDQSRDAAEFSRRFLEDQNATSSLNVVELLDEAEDVACSCGSGFIWIYPDPRAGGPKPKTMRASAAATTVQDALFATTIGEDGQPTSTQQPGPYVDRFVAPDQSLTDDANAADIVWGPKLCGDVLSGRNVRFLPPTCRSLHDAEGVLIAAYTTLGDLKSRFRDTVGKMSVEQLRKMASYKPPQAAKLLPKWAQNIGKGSSGNGQDGPPSDTPILVITAMRTAKGEYPKGCYVVMAGGTLILDRRPWVRMVTDPDTQKQTEKPNKIWLSQFRQFIHTKDRNPYGHGLVDKLIDGDPLIAIAIGSLIDRVEKSNNPHLFVPIGSGISDKHLSLPRGTPIPYNAANGGKPVNEDLGPFAPEVMELYSLVAERMDQRAMLGSAVARGLDDPNAVSGTAKKVALSAAGIQLSRVKRGFDTGYVRTEEIILEAGQMTFTAPQMISVVGEDGAYKFKEFTAANLGTTVDVRIKPGTGTMLNPEQKEEITLNRLDHGLITLEQAQEQLRGHLRASTGAEDDPSLLRVKRQINDWEAGPPEGWAPPIAPPPQIVADPATGQPVEQQAPPALDPADPFAFRLPVDLEQDVARVRHYQLRRVLNGVKFARKPGPWQQLLLNEYEAMRQAAGVMTLQEQAKAQADAAALQALGKVNASAKVDAGSVGEFIDAEQQALATPPSAPAANQPPQPHLTSPVAQPSPQNTLAQRG